MRNAGGAPRDACVPSFDGKHHSGEVEADSPGFAKDIHSEKSVRPGKPFDCSKPGNCRKTASKPPIRNLTSGKTRLLISLLPEICVIVSELFLPRLVNECANSFRNLGILWNRVHVQVEGIPAECSVLHKKEAVKPQVGHRCSSGKALQGLTRRSVVAALLTPPTLITRGKSPLAELGTTIRMT